MCFPVNFVKVIRKFFFVEHFWWLLLKSRTSKCNCYEQSDCNLTVTKLKCMYNKYITHEKLQANSRSGKNKTIYLNGSYL